MSRGIWHPCGCLLNRCSTARLIWPAIHVSKLFVISHLLLISRLHHSFIQSMLLVKRMLSGDHSNKLGLSDGPGCTMMMPMTLNAVTFVCLQLSRRWRYLMLNHVFVSSGFSNWKDVTVSFKKHQLSTCHCEAVDVDYNSSHYKGIWRVTCTAALPRKGY